MFNKQYNIILTLLVVYILAAVLVPLFYQASPLDEWLIFIALIITLTFILLDEESTNFTDTISGFMQPLLNSDKYTFVSILPLSKNNFTIGRNIKDGIEAAFISTNIRGGVNGKKVELKVYDNEDTVTKTKQLILDLQNSEEVMGLLTPVGLESTITAIQLLQDTKPIIGPFTTSSIVRKSPVLNMSMMNYDIMNYISQYFTSVHKKRK